MPRNQPDHRRTAPSRIGDSSPASARKQQALAVLQQFRFIFKSAKKHFQWVERETGISGSQLWALAEIAAAPGLRVTELARAMVIHQSTASNLVDKLVQRKLVRRERSREDQRVVRLRLTQHGEAVVLQAPKPYAGVLPDALVRLPPAELSRLDELLKSVARNMRVRDASGRRTPLADI